MKKTSYNSNQIKELLKNSNVKSCKWKYITYTKKCKHLAVELYNKWIPYKEIFIKLWFPEYIINSEIPKKSLKNWRNFVKNNWIENLWNLKQWRLKKDTKHKDSELSSSNMTKDEELEYLRTKVAYLEEVKKYFNEEFP